MVLKAFQFLEEHPLGKLPLDVYLCPEPMGHSLNDIHGRHLPFGEKRVILLSQESSDRHVKRGGDFMKHPDGDVLLPSLDAADISEVPSAAPREIFLRPTMQLAEVAYTPP